MVIASGAKDLPLLRRLRSFTSFRMTVVFLSLSCSILNAAPFQGSSDDVVASIENVVMDVGNDTVFGSSLANTLDGGYGNDVIYGLAGSDTLLGFNGDDIRNLFTATKPDATSL